MKKRIFIIVALLSVLIITGCDKIVNKTEFSLNEEAIIDDIYIKLIDSSYKNNKLKLAFEIKNNRNSVFTINPDFNFVTYEVGGVKLPNKYVNASNIVKSKNTITYYLEYETKEKEIYEVYFYSGIVENNIKFSIVKTDINK